MQGCFEIWKSVCVIHCFKRITDQNTLITPMEEKTILQELISTLLKNKKSQQSRRGRKFPPHGKVRYENPTINIRQSERRDMFPLRSGTGRVTTTLTMSTHHCPGARASNVQRERNESRAAQKGDVMLYSVTGYIVIVHRKTKIMNKKLPKSQMNSAL